MAIPAPPPTPATLGPAEIALISPFFGRPARWFRAGENTAPGAPPPRQLFSVDLGQEARLLRPGPLHPRRPPRRDGGGFRRGDPPALGRLRPRPRARPGRAHGRQPRH